MICNWAKNADNLNQKRLREDRLRKDRLIYVYLQIHTYTHTHTYPHTYTHTHIHTYTHTHKSTCKHARIIVHNMHTIVHKCIHTWRRACIQTYLHRNAINTSMRILLLQATESFGTVTGVGPASSAIPTSKALIICRAAASLRAIVVDRLLVFAEVVAVPLHSRMPSALPAATE